MLKNSNKTFINLNENLNLSSSSSSSSSSPTTTTQQPQQQLINQQQQQQQGEEEEKEKEKEKQEEIDKKSKNILNQNQSTNQINPSLKFLINEFNKLNHQLNQTQDRLKQIESSSSSASISNSNQNSQSNSQSNHQIKLQDENRQLWTLISKLKFEIKELKFENKQLKSHLNHSNHHHQNQNQTTNHHHQSLNIPILNHHQSLIPSNSNQNSISPTSPKPQIISSSSSSISSSSSSSSSSNHNHNQDDSSSTPSQLINHNLIINNNSNPTTPTNTSNLTTTTTTSSSSSSFTPINSHLNQPTSPSLNSISQSSSSPLSLPPPLPLPKSQLRQNDSNQSIKSNSNSNSNSNHLHHITNHQNHQQSQKLPIENLINLTNSNLNLQSSNLNHSKNSHFKPIKSNSFNSNDSNHRSTITHPSNHHPNPNLTNHHHTSNHPTHHHHHHHQKLRRKASSVDMTQQQSSSDNINNNPLTINSNLIQSISVPSIQNLSNHQSSNLNSNLINQIPKSDLKINSQKSHSNLHHPNSNLSSQSKSNFRLSHHPTSLQQPLKNSHHRHSVLPSDNNLNSSSNSTPLSHTTTNTTSSSNSNRLIPPNSDSKLSTNSSSSQNHLDYPISIGSDPSTKLASVNLLNNKPNKSNLNPSSTQINNLNVLINHPSSLLQTPQKHSKSSSSPTHSHHTNLSNSPSSNPSNSIQPNQSNHPIQPIQPIQPNQQSHSINSDSISSPQPMAKCRMLTPNFLPFTQIKVTNSHIRANEKYKEVISFSISINISIPPESDPDGKGVKVNWVVEKLYSDVLTLDHHVKSKHSKSQNKSLAQLPDRALFKDHAPSKVDARKAVLQKYLQSLCAVQLNDKSDICEFFNSNILINEKNHQPSRPGFMQGYLTKKGRNFGGWQTRFYVLEGPVLEYFDTRGGNRLGHIIITGAQIGRQQQRSQESNDDSYRHAFLIRMHKREKEGEIDHILCAETDEERDAWVDALTCYITGRYISSDPSIPPQSDLSQLRNHHNHSSHSTSSDHRSNPKPSLDNSPKLDLSTTNNNNLHQASSHNRTISDQRYESKSNRNLENSKDDSSSLNNLKPSIDPINTLPSSDHRDQLLKSSNSSSENRTPILDSRLISQHTNNLPPPPQQQQQPTQQQQQQQQQHNLPTTPRALVQNRHIPQNIHSSPQQEQVISDAESIVTSSIDRPNTPDSQQRPKISGPMNGAPITGGYRIKPPEEKKAKFRSAFWGFAGRNTALDRKEARESSSNQTNSNNMLSPFAPAPRPVFGVSLQEAVSVARVHEGLDLPAVVFRCVEFLEAKGAVEEEGIYRLSGSSVNIKAYKERFNTEGDFNLLESSKNEYHDVHAVAGLLKQFLRELASPILTREFHGEFLKVIDLSRRSDKVNELGRLCAQLPLPNYTLLRFLSAHLIHIVQNEKANKMSMRNVGIVFSPTLGMPAPLFALLLKEFDLIFNIEGDNRAPIRLSDESDPSLNLNSTTPVDKRISRNSIMYSATGANMLMEHTKLLRSKANVEEESDSDVEYDSSSEPDDELITSSKKTATTTERQRQLAMSQLIAEPTLNNQSENDESREKNQLTSTDSKIDHHNKDFLMTSTNKLELSNPC